LGIISARLGNPLSMERSNRTTSRPWQSDASAAHPCERFTRIALQSVMQQEYHPGCADKTKTRSGDRMKRLILAADLAAFCATPAARQPVRSGFGRDQS
jgi:hypothetical protein